MRSEDSDDVLVELVAIASKEEFTFNLVFLFAKDCNQRFSFETGFLQRNNSPADTGHAI